MSCQVHVDTKDKAQKKKTSQFREEEKKNLPALIRETVKIRVFLPGLFVGFLPDFG
jgi:hypothetical protein